MKNKFFTCLFWKNIIKCNQHLNLKAMKRKVNNLFFFSELTIVEKLADPGLLKDTFTMLLAEILVRVS